MIKKKLKRVLIIRLLKQNLKTMEGQAYGKFKRFVKVNTNNNKKVCEASSSLIHERIIAIQHDIFLFNMMKAQHPYSTISLILLIIKFNKTRLKIETSIIPCITKDYIVYYIYF